MTRDELLRTFQSRFYVWLPNEHIYETPICSDVFSALAKALEYFALFDIEHSKRDSMHTIYMVGLNPTGPWELLPIGPAWRLCSSQVQAIVENALIAKAGGDWVTRVLIDGDVESLEAMLDNLATGN